MLRLVLDRLRAWADEHDRNQPKKLDNWRWAATCPCHESPPRQELSTFWALSVSRGDRVQCVMYCHAGCEARAVVEALGIDWNEFKRSWR